MAVASEDSDEIAVAEAGERGVGSAVEHAVLEWACLEGAIASSALVDKLVAIEDAAVGLVDAEAGAVEGAAEGAECIETVEAVVDLVVDASATQPLPVDCRWVDWAYRHS